MHVRRVRDVAGVPVPDFILVRHMRVQRVALKDSNRVRVEVNGMDVDGTPLSFVRAMDVERGTTAVAKCTSEPLSATVAAEAGALRLRFGFHGHYGEPELAVPIDRDCDDVLRLELNVSRAATQWVVHRGAARGHAAAASADADLVAVMRRLSVSAPVTAASAGPADVRA